MSKLIVEMEMPKGCTWTDENENGHLCPLLDIDCDCVLQEKGRKIGWAEQYAKCPIKGELPEQHGDLIDRDKFVDKYIRHYTEQERKMNLVFAAVEVKQDFSDMIYEEDAVIEAERKDDEQIH